MLKKFLITVFVFAVPVVLLLIPYFVGDPFKVLYSYDSYVEKGEPMYININRGYVSTEMFARYNSVYHYDSFILGSSRSGYYRSYDWYNYLPESSSIFHFDGYGESLYQVYTKLNYLDGKVPINNVLLCIDKELLYMSKPYYTPLHATSPRLINYTNYFSFQMIYIKAYLTPQFLRTYLDLFLSREIKPYMINSGIIDTSIYIYNLKENEVGRKLYADKIDTTYYTPKLMQTFYKREQIQQIDTLSVIDVGQEQLLEKIKDIFVRNNTDYKIIINPNYDQIKLSNQDMEKLQYIFGENLYDFSGINLFTDNVYNYVDVNHFKQYIAADIMRIIYIKDPIKQNQLLDSLYNIEVNSSH